MAQTHTQQRRYTTPTLHTLFPDSSIWNNGHHKMKQKLMILKENETTFNKDLIHNLSTHTLKTDELQLLQKGLKYSPPIDSCKPKTNLKTSNQTTPKTEHITKTLRTPPSID